MFRCQQIVGKRTQPPKLAATTRISVSPTQEEENEHEEKRRIGWIIRRWRRRQGPWKIIRIDFADKTFLLLHSLGSVHNLLFSFLPPCSPSRSPSRSRSRSRPLPFASLLPGNASRSGLLLRLALYITFARVTLAADTVNRIGFFFLSKTGKRSSQTRKQGTKQQVLTFKYSLVASCHSLVMVRGGGLAKAWAIAKRTAETRSP